MINETRPNAIQLQSIGWVPAVPAADLKVGNVLIWNFGGTTELVAIRDVSSKFLELTERWYDERKGVCDSPRRVKKDRLVGLSPLDEHRAANPQIETTGSVPTR